MLKIRVIPGKYYAPCSKGFVLDSVALSAGEIELSAEETEKVKTHPDYETLVSIGAIEVLSDSSAEAPSHGGRKKKEITEVVEA